MSGNVNDADWHAAEKKADIYFLKSIVENIIRRAGVDFNQIQITDNLNSGIFTEQLAYSIDGKQLCELGEVNAMLLKQTDIKDVVFYAAINWDTLMECIR